MNKALAWCILVCAAAGCVVLSLATPWVLSDGNEFLRSFVGGDLLSLLGIVVTISIASAANLHLELNRLEQHTTIPKPFTNTRASVRHSAYSMKGFGIDV